MCLSTDRSHRCDDLVRMSWTSSGQDARYVFVILHITRIFFHISETLLKQKGNQREYQLGQTREINSLGESKQIGAQITYLDCVSSEGTLILQQVVLKMA